MKGGEPDEIKKKLYTPSQNEKGVIYSKLEGGDFRGLMVFKASTLLSVQFLLL